MFGLIRVTVAITLARRGCSTKDARIFHNTMVNTRGR